MNSKAVSFLSGYLILSVVCLSFFLSSLFFFFGLSILPYSTYASFFITLFTCIYLARRHFIIKDLVCSLAIFFLVIILSYIISLHFFDVSWNGQNYHQEAIIQLANGWNPIMEKLYPSNEAEKYSFLWNNHYPKAVEITQTGIYKISGLIESGKAINLLIIVAAFCLVLSCLMQFNKIRLEKAMFFSFLAAFNPIAISQSLSFYIDGNMASLLLCLLCVLFLFYFEPKGYLGMILVLLSVYFMNVKFTAIVYFVILAGTFLVITFLNRKKVVFKRSLIIFTCSLILGIFVCGYNPYVTNYKEHSHPFYPIMGKGQVDSIQKNRPVSKYYDKTNSIKNFLVLLFSEGSIRNVKLKIPFTIRKKEILAYTYPDARLGGFGPFYSGILILTFILLLISLRDFRTNRMLYLILLSITISVIINPEAWWARYVPQFWLIPVLTLIFLKLSKTNILVKAINTTLAILIFFNIAIITGSYVRKNAKDSYLVYKQLKELANLEMPLKVDFSTFRSNRARLAEHHLQFVEVSNLSNDNSIRLYGSITRIQRELPKSAK